MKSILILLQIKENRLIIKAYEKIIDDYLRPKSKLRL